LARALCSDTRAGQSRLVAADRRLGGDRVDLQEELTGPDAIALLDRQPRHTAHGLRADVHGLLWLDLARRRHNGLEVAALDAFGGDRDALVLAPEVHHARNAGQDDHGENRPYPFLAQHSTTLLTTS
jgi:hypothetical protein